MRLRKGNRGSERPGHSPGSHCVWVVWPGFGLESVHSRALCEGLGLACVHISMFPLFLLGKLGEGVIPRIYYKRGGHVRFESGRCSEFPARGGEWLSPTPPAPACPPPRYPLQDTTLTAGLMQGKHFAAFVPPGLRAEAQKLAGGPGNFPAPP